MYMLPEMEQKKCLSITLKLPRGDPESFAGAMEG